MTTPKVLQNAPFTELLSTHGQCVTIHIMDVEADRIQTVYAHRTKQPHYSHHDPSQIFMLHTIENHILSIFHEIGYPFHTAKVLDVGCGGGHWLRQFIQWGMRPDHLAGIDLLENRITLAKRRCPVGVNLQCGSAETLPFPSDSFNLVSQFIMFSSVLDPAVKQRIGREMMRVTAPGGAILWCDFFFNNPRNPNVRGIGKSELHWLFPGCTMKCKRIVLAPPITRVLAKYSQMLCEFLEWLKVGNTFYLAWIQKTPANVWRRRQIPL